MTDNAENSVESEIEDGKNKRRIKCQYCKSIILNSKSGMYVNIEFQLPVIKIKKDSQEEGSDEKKDQTIETESVCDFWLVKDMYTFENIGFSNTVDNRKYLSCADCEIGPLGYHDLNTKESFLALSRVKHIQ